MARRSRWRASLEGSPGRLRVVAALAVLASLTFALLGGGGYLMWSNSVKAAQADTTQLVLVQRVQNDLMEANALASTAYLAGKLPMASTQGTYEAKVKDAAEQMAQIAAGSPQDAEQLATLNAAMTRYLDQMSLARGANDQRLLVGAAYLRGGYKVLRDEIAPALDQLGALARVRVDEDYNRANLATGLLIGGAVVALVGGGLAQMWLARRTHRYLNVPAVAGSAVILMAAGLGLAVLSSAATHAGDVGRHSYAVTAALAEARTKAFDAKANEALGLIFRGNGKSYESDPIGPDLVVAQAALTQAVAAGADPKVEQTFAAWIAVHQQVRAADDKGDWAGAQALAVEVKPGSSNDAFGYFDEKSRAILDVQKGLTASRLSAAGRWLAWLGGLTVIVGVLAAAGAWAGFSQRWEEYR
jgi:hypothetical protein